MPEFGLEGFIYFNEEDEKINSAKFKLHFAADLNKGPVNVISYFDNK